MNYSTIALIPSTRVQQTNVSFQQRAVVLKNVFLLSNCVTSAAVLNNAEYNVNTLSRLNWVKVGWSPLPFLCPGRAHPPERETRLLRSHRPQTHAQRGSLSPFRGDFCWIQHGAPDTSSQPHSSTLTSTRSRRTRFERLYDKTTSAIDICTYMNFWAFHLYPSLLSTSTMGLWARRHERKLTNAESVFLAFTLIAEGKNASNVLHSNVTCM